MGIVSLKSRKYIEFELKNSKNFSGQTSKLNLCHVNLIVESLEIIEWKGGEEKKGDVYGSMGLWKAIWQDKYGLFFMKF